MNTTFYRIVMCVAMIALAISMFLVLLVLNDALLSGDPFAQVNFPCQEDEVLMYARQFGPDRVGCVQIDLLRGD